MIQLKYVHTNGTHMEKVQKKRFFLGKKYSFFRICAWCVHIILEWDQRGCNFFLLGADGFTYPRAFQKLYFPNLKLSVYMYDAINIFLSIKWSQFSFSKGAIWKNQFLSIFGIKSEFSWFSHFFDNFSSKMPQEFSKKYENFNGRFLHGNPINNITSIVGFEVPIVLLKNRTCCTIPWQTNFSHSIKISKFIARIYPIYKAFYLRNHQVFLKRSRFFFRFTFLIENTISSFTRGISSS